MYVKCNFDTTNTSKFIMFDFITEYNTNQLHHYKGYNASTSSYIATVLIDLSSIMSNVELTSYTNYNFLIPNILLSPSNTTVNSKYLPHSCSVKYLKIKNDYLESIIS